MAPIARTAEELFWSHLQQGDRDECWLWTASTAHGYGKFRAERRNLRSHRFAYELMVAPIPDGMGIDHLCHTRDGACPGGPTCPHRRCCNPSHLKPETSWANNARSKSLTADRLRWTACPAGHDYTIANTYIDPRGRRNCRKCRALASQRHYRKQAS